MIIFDTLAELESYLPAVPALRHVITVLDRSLPYEKGPGDYACPEEPEVRYRVDSYLTSQSGFAFSVRENTLALVVALEGEEILSSPSSKDVMVLAEGRFALLSEGEYHRGVSTNLPVAVKDALFTFPEGYKDDKGNIDTL